MMYVDFTAGSNEYQLRLTTRGVIALEKVLGMNPIGIFGDGTQLPTITTMVQILHASMQQYNHGIDLNKAYDIFDDYLADGHTMVDFIPVILEIYKTSGLIANDKKIEVDGEKN